MTFSQSIALFFGAAFLVGCLGSAVVQLRAWLMDRSKRDRSRFENIGEFSGESDREALARLMTVIDELNRQIDPDHEQGNKH